MFVPYPRSYQCYQETWTQRCSRSSKSNLSLCWLQIVWTWSHPHFRKDQPRSSRTSHQRKEVPWIGRSSWYHSAVLLIRNFFDTNALKTSLLSSPIEWQGIFLRGFREICFRYWRRAACNRRSSSLRCTDLRYICRHLQCHYLFRTHSKLVN